MAELGIGDIAAEVVRYTYRPGWTLRIILTRATGYAVPHGPDWYEASLQVDAEVDDARNPGRRFRLCAQFPVPYFVAHDIAGFRHWLARTLQDLEIHESREWLRYDGELVDDPHRREANPWPTPPSPTTPVGEHHAAPDTKRPKP
jgi:hypothetical protein